MTEKWTESTPLLPGQRDIQLKPLSLWHLLSRLFWTSWEFPVYTLLLLLLSLTAEVIIYQVGTLTSKYYSVLPRRSFHDFEWLTLKACGLLLASALVKSGVHWIGGRFVLSMRVRWTQVLTSFYLEHQRFYHLSQMRNEELKIDHPDQRLSQDIDRWTKTVRTLLEKLLVTPLMVAYYGWEVVRVCGWLALALIFTYFLVSTGLCQILAAKALSRAVQRREQQEGDLRYILLRFVNYISSIALVRSVDVEQSIIWHALDRWRDSQRSFLSKEFFLKCMTTFISEFGAIVSFIVIAIPIFTHQLDDVGDQLPSMISKNAFVSMYLIYKLSSITELMDTFSEFHAYGKRLIGFYDAMVEATKEVSITVVSNAQYLLQVKDLMFRLPNDRCSLSLNHFCIEPHQHWMIQGPNGCGKTTFLKTLAGLHPSLAGTIELSDHPILFLPQVPYLPMLSLQQILAYPHSEPCTLLELEEFLDQVGLSYLLEDTHRLLTAATYQKDSLPHFTKYQDQSDWHHLLSPGELQKLNLARVLYQKPALVMMDESTSSLDEASEDRILRQIAKNGTTIVAVRHRPFEGFFQHSLIFDDQGAIRIE